MEIEGFIHRVFDAASGVSQKTGNAWMSQEFVLGYYWFPNQTQPSYMSCRLFGEDKIRQANLQPNDEIKIRFFIEAREGTSGRWFNEVRINSISKKKPDGTYESPQAATSGSTSAQPAQGGPSAQGAGDNGTQGKNDLPF